MKLVNLEGLSEGMVKYELYEALRLSTDSYDLIEAVLGRNESSFSHLKKLLDNYMPDERRNMTTLAVLNGVLAYADVRLILHEYSQNIVLSPLEIVASTFVAGMAYALWRRFEAYKTVKEIYESYVLLIIGQKVIHQNYKQ
jgi:hypothetical protein